MTEDSKQQVAFSTRHYALNTRHPTEVESERILE
jgi:hypothetical protein